MFETLDTLEPAGFEPRSSAFAGRAPLPLDGEVAWNASATAFFFALFAASPATAAAMDPLAAPFVFFHMAPHLPATTAPGSTL